MIQIDLLLPLIVFALTVGITPGPNNVMLTASGVNFGFRRTLPHMGGIIFGFPVMVLAVGLGLGNLFAAYPQLHNMLRVVAVGYLLWLAWKIATAGRTEAAGVTGSPINFIQAAGFQWVNPKAWVLAVGAVATYTQLDGDVLAEVGVVTLVMFLSAIPCVLTWALFGTAIGRVLTSVRARTVFNWSMATLLVLSLVPLVFV